MHHSHIYFVVTFCSIRSPTKTNSSRFISLRTTPRPPPASKFSFFSLFILYTWMLAPETRNLRWVFVLLFSSLKSLRSAHLQRPLELHLNVRATHKKYLHLNFCLSICMSVCPHFFHVNKL
jgi:hypothetical protein